MPKHENRELSVLYVVHKKLQVQVCVNVFSVVCTERVLDSDVWGLGLGMSLFGYYDSKNLLVGSTLYFVTPMSNGESKVLLVLPILLIPILYQ